MEIVREYAAGLRRIFGDRLEGVVLYGSHARGDAVEGSDIDVLVVLAGPFDYAEAVRSTSELTARMSLEHDVVLSRVFVTGDEVRCSELPFFAAVRREGVAA